VSGSPSLSSTVMRSPGCTQTRIGGLGLRLPQVLSLLPCRGTNPPETRLPLPQEINELLALCQPTNGSSARRLVNISTTSLRASYDVGTASATYRPAEEDALTEASLRLAGAGFRKQAGVLREVVTFPAGSSVVVVPRGDELPALEIGTDPALGQLALIVRAAADLFGQLPWSDLGHHRRDSHPHRHPRRPPARARSPTL
jgi:hypothetical protein